VAAGRGAGSSQAKREIRWFKLLGVLAT